MKKGIVLFFVLLISTFLFFAVCAEETLAVGSKGDDVLEMKRRLQELRYIKDGSLTKKFTDQTQTSLSEFQRMNGLNETGVLDAETRELLFSDAAVSKPYPTMRPLATLPPSELPEGAALDSEGFFIGNGELIEEKDIPCDISDIDIDHVKSIDSTLRDLEGKFQVLKIVSEIFKRMDKASRKDNADIKQLTSNALKEIKENNDFVIDKLTEELNLIKKDSILRLMNSEYNKKKSNGESFEKIIKTKESYLGIVLSKVTLIENNPEDKNNHSDYNKEDIIIYQDLADNGIMLAKRSSQMDKGRKVKITKKLVDYI